MGILNSKNPGSEATMIADERVSYVMLFCALMLVRNSKATLEESIRILPLVGSAKHLAGELSGGPTS